MFVKPDKYPAGEIEEKAPRAIQHRHPVFNLLLAKFLKPMEEALYQTLDKYDMRWSAKGLNNNQRAEIIVESASLFDSPVFLLIDHSKFDSTVTVEHLKIMHRFYTKIMPDRMLAYLLHLQLRNKGISSHGIRYKVLGTKMSGDYNTALDNTLLNYLCLSVFCPEGKIFVDGDDSVIALDQRDLEKTLKRFGWFSRMGFTTKMEVVKELAEVEFCRSKIVGINTHPTMAREPRRAMSNLAVTLKNYTGKGLCKYIAGNALCEMHRSSGVPILFALAKRLYEAYGQYGYILDTDSSFKLEQYKTELREPDNDARLDYYRAYGISPGVQVQIEEELRTKNIRDYVWIDAYATNLVDIVV